MVLKVRRYDSPRDEAGGAEFDIRFNLAVDIGVTARFYSPEDFVPEEGFGFDRAPGQLEPDIVRVPEPAAGNR